MEAVLRAYFPEFFFPSPAGELLDYRLRGAHRIAVA
jgi:hypothetical protein